MRRPFFSFLILNVTLFTVLGTRLVRIFAEREHVRLRLAAGAGYFPLPSLSDPTTASCLLSGSFYTVTLGIGITMLELLLCMTAMHFPRPRSAAMVLLTVLSAGLLLLVVHFGRIDLLFTAGIVVSPLLAALLTQWGAWLPGHEPGANFLRHIDSANNGSKKSVKSTDTGLARNTETEKPARFPTLLRGVFGRDVSRIVAFSVVLLVAWVGWCAGVRDFTSFRDIVLLSNGPGRLITEAYYRGTVDAARPLESAGQKPFLLAGFDGDSFTSPDRERFKRILLPYGILFAAGSGMDSAADVFFRKNPDDSFSFAVRGGGTGIPFSPSDPHVRDVFDHAGDPSGGVKRLVLFSLVALLPLFFLMIVGYTFRFLLRPLGFRSRAVLAAAIVGIAVAAALFIPDGRDGPLSGSGEPGRITAKDTPSPAVLARSGDLRTRVHAAGALGAVDRPDALDALLELSRDPATVVVSAAVYGLSRRSEPAAGKRLAALCTGHPHPYICDKALRALIAHGWISWNR